MDHKQAWQRVIAGDILYRTHRESLSKILDVPRTLKYFTESQQPKGFFYRASPVIYNTHAMCGIPMCGILHCLGEKPSENTIKYIKSLQVGRIGFAETTGEMAWIDKSYLALQMCDWFSIEVQRKQEMVEYFQEFQDDSGGFGSELGQHPSLEGTAMAVSILKHLGAKPVNAEGAIRWLTMQNPQSMTELYHYVQTLAHLDYSFTEDEKMDIMLKVSRLDNQTYQELLYRERSLETLGYPLSDEALDEPLPEHPIELFYFVRLLEMHSKLNTHGKNLLARIRERELPQGGFASGAGEPAGIIHHGYMLHALHLLEGLPAVDKPAFRDWLFSVAHPDGWGATANSPEYHEYTTTSLTALSFCGEKPKNGPPIITKKREELNAVLSYQEDANYHVLRTIKNTIETHMLLGEALPEDLPTEEKVMEYYRDGGFGSRVAYLYATFWAVRSLYLLERYHESNGSRGPRALNRIRDSTIKWINSCQNQDRGFGPMPGEPSNLQSTFCAHYSLWMLGAKSPKKNKAMKWILDLQKDDGGFGGSKEMASEMLHILYAVGSLAILSSN
jgi:prenyltransferase beta subunit